jgi:hypothetical protein
MHEAGLARFCQLVPKIPHLSRRNSSQVCDIFLGSVSAPWGGVLYLSSSVCAYSSWNKPLSERSRGFALARRAP